MYYLNNALISKNGSGCFMKSLTEDDNDEKRKAESIQIVKSVRDESKFAIFT